MLTSLFIRDYAIVPRLQLELEPGFTVLTGETGAGKSILIDALMLALGARSETDNIRAGVDSAEITAGFTLHPEGDAARWIKDNELHEDDSCIVRRLLHRNKSSKAFINGRPVTLQSLRDFGQRVVDIHGQHEHQSLLKREVQRRTVDDFARLGKEVDALERGHQEIMRLRTELEQLSRKSSSRLHELDLLRFQCAELAEMDVREGEFSDLERQHSRLAHARELRDGIEHCHLGLYAAEQQSATDVLAHCLNRLIALLDYEPDLQAVCDLLNQASIQVDEAASQLGRLMGKIEVDPQRMEEIDQRMRTLMDLARKHRVEPNALADTRQQLTARLGELESADIIVEDLQRALETALRDYQSTAAEVSKRRVAAADELSQRVTRRMQELGMRGGRFEVTVTPRDAATPTRFGLDDIVFRVSTNPGQPLRPLTKVASGGELSRISLAIQVITAAVGRVPTLIFDEVDVGIGGGVAEIVGQRLRSLADTHQVLCVTHLPQVAAQGQRHFQVRKHDDPTLKVTVRSLLEERRVQEIARMLGGVNITEQSVAHAHEMLSRAGTDTAAASQLSLAE